MRISERALLTLRGRAALAPFLTALAGDARVFRGVALAIPMFKEQVRKGASAVRPRSRSGGILTPFLTALLVLLSLSAGVYAQTPQATPPSPAAPRSVTFP